jgi:drug/metabolite transporter (DMT)-like permease
MAATSDWTVFSKEPLEFVVAVLFLGIPGLALGHWFWQEGVARLGAARAGIFLYIEPLATTLLAVAYLHEELKFVTGVGGVLVLAGVYCAERKRGGRGDIRRG